MNMESGGEVFNVNIADIIARLRDWELSVTSREGGELEGWIFQRIAPDNSRLQLSINTSKGYVRFVERLNHEIVFSALCSGVQHVDIGDDELTFRGEIHYKIWNSGMFHEIRLKDSSYSDLPVSERSYDSGKTS